MTTVQLAGYQILEQLYAGSKTLIYRARRESDQKPVVIKQLQDENPPLAELAKFRNQYAIAKNLNLPEIIQTYSLESHASGYVLVMEDFGGISLKQELQRWGSGGLGSTTEGIEEFLRIAIQIASALDGLFRQRVIHKDIKPANILIHPLTRQVKLIDFSIASLLPRENRVLTNPNVLEGTLAYLSPEQTGRMNRAIDYRTDFYSLGITFYELLTGRLPFRATDPGELVHCHIAKQAPTIHSLNIAIPTVLSALVERLMAKNAEDRYQSALGLKYDLEVCLAQMVATGQIQEFELGRRDVSDHFAIAEKLYGRQAEVEALLTAFERVAGDGEVTASALGGESSACSALVLIAGFSGVGKTAIVNEVHKPIVRRRGYFIQGKYDQFQRNIPFSAIVQALRDLLEQLLTESNQQIEQWKTKILEAVGENGALLIEVLPELEWVIGHQPPTPELEFGARQNLFNWVFQRFIQVFPSAAHPLVLFLDDLQWIDSASLHLIQSLMSNSATPHLLLLGAYRDNEVSRVHPLMRMVDELCKAGVAVDAIALSPLSLKDVNDLIADTLNCSVETAGPLAQLVFTTTQGNPFFSHQFLKTLYDDGYIQFNFDLGSWQWDTTQVQALSLTDDVVEFMSAQLQKLSSKTQELLKLAACIGNQFDLKTLAIVSDKMPTDVAADLWEALQAGLLLPGSDGYRLFSQDIEHHNQEHNRSHNIDDQRPESESKITNSSTSIAGTSCTYRFLHDRVQQAAYLLIPAHDKAAIHQTIGQLLLRNTPVAEWDERIFEIVNQLNYGVERITSVSERNDLAQLNWQAAQRAKATTAYRSALEYATVGIRLLPLDGWQTQYALTLDLYVVATEVALLCGAFEQMEEWAEVVLEQAQTILDRVPIYEFKVQAYTSQGKLLEAIAIARQALGQFGLQFPEEPDQDDIQQAIQATMALIAETSPEALVNSPPMVAPDKLAVMRLISGVIPAVYNAQPLLFPLITLSQVNTTLQFGNAPDSAFSYVNYALLLKSIVQDIEAANQFGKLALDVIAKLESKAIKAKIYYVIGAFITPSKFHLRQAVSRLIEGYQVALETGNPEFVGYYVQDICLSSYFLGANLVSLEQEIQAYCKVLEDLKQIKTLNHCYIFWQTVLNWLGQSADPCMLSGAACEQEELLQRLVDANGISGLEYFYLHKLILCYCFGELEQAIAHAAQARHYLAGVSGFAAEGVFYFYESLVSLAAQPTDPDHQKALLKQVTDNQAILSHWAKFAPMNYLHKYDLVEAERYRVEGDWVTAMEYYDRAITNAQAQDYVNEAALACELAAQFYLAWNKEIIAQAYITRAYEHYKTWGANAKLKDLEHRYTQLLSSIVKPQIGEVDLTEASASVAINCAPIYPESTTSGSTFSEGLDLATVVKASQAISGEIQLEKLLLKLMQFVIENGGAETGALLLQQENELLIQAQATRQNQSESLQTKALQSIPVYSSQEIPISIINYVSRRLKALVIDDATAERTFAADPYIIDRQPKSVLCTPISKQGRLIGILYLENNLTKGAFTHDRLQVLKLLTTQAAISLENAMLYQNLAAANERLEDYSHTLEQKVDERTGELHQKTQHLEQTLQELQKTQTQLIQAEKMSSLGQMVAGIAHEINNPINFIHGNLAHLNEYVHDLLNLVTTYQQEYPQSTPKIEEVIEQVDLDFLVDDLAKLIGSMKVGSDRIRTIISGLRNFSRLDEAEMKPVDIHEGIDSTLMLLQHRLKAKDNRLAIEVIKEYSQLPAVNCFASQLNQVFMNILNNALDALFEQTSNQTFDTEGNQTKLLPYIRIRTEQTASGMIKICIADNGVGMTEQVKQRLFDPFFTTKPIGKGTGLGLSISYSIIEKHGGQIDVLSEPGKGTEFVITIPGVMDLHFPKAS